MKHNGEIWKAFLGFILFLSGFSSIGQEKRNLTLQDAINLALKNSKQLKLNQAKIDEASGALQEAKEKKLPDATASGTYMRLNNPAVDLKLKTNNNGGTGTSSPRNSPVINQAAYAILNASLPIYAGGRIRYGIESSKYLAEAVRLDADNERQAVIQNTIDAYNNLFKSKAAVTLVDSSVEEARRRVADYKSLEKNGVLARNDLLKAQLAESNSELSLLDAQNNWQLANVNMNLMLGLPDSTEIIPDSSGFNKALNVKTIPEYVQLALQNRKDLAALQFRQKASEFGVKSVKAEKYPSLALTAGYIALDIPNALTVYNAVNIGLGVQYNIGTLWKNRSRVEQAEARVKQAQANEDILDDAIRLQVNQAYQAFLLSRKKIDVYNTAILQAEENYRVLANKFNNGLATVTEILDADVARLQARLNKTFAESDSYVAYTKLLQTTGQINLNNQ